MWWFPDSVLVHGRPTLRGRSSTVPGRMSTSPGGVVHRGERGYARVVRRDDTAHVFGLWEREWGAAAAVWGRGRPPPTSSAEA